MLMVLLQDLLLVLLLEQLILQLLLKEHKRTIVWTLNILMLLLHVLHYLKQVY